MTKRLSQKADWPAIAMVIAIAFTVVSCEKTVIVDVPPHFHQIVAKGLFTPDSVWSVHVSSSVGYEERIGPFPIEHARVEIWQEGALLETLRHRVSGMYAAAQGRPEPGKNYALKVSATGFERVEADISIPSVSVVPRVDVARLPDNGRGPLFAVSATIDDPANERNYYAIDVVHSLRIGQDEGAVVVNNLHGFESSDVVLRGFDFGEPEYFDVAYFEDDLFDGKTQTIDLIVSDPSSSFDGDQIESSLTLRVYVTDEAFFRYHRTMRQQQRTDDNPFVEPVRLYSNTSNGYGIVAGYRSYPTLLAQW